MTMIGVPKGQHSARESEGRTRRPNIRGIALLPLLWVLTSSCGSADASYEADYEKTAGCLALIHAGILDLSQAVVADGRESDEALLADLLEALNGGVAGLAAASPPAKYAGVHADIVAAAEELVSLDDKDFEQFLEDSDHYQAVLIRSNVPLGNDERCSD